MTQEGLPYIFGGEAPGVGFDCSGLARFSWNALLALVNAHPLVGATYSIFNEYVFDQRNGHRDEPCLPGDLLFIPGSDAIGTEPGHVMLYDSPGQVLQAEMTGTLIGIFPFDTLNGWQYRSRPSLAFPLPPPPNPNAPTEADLTRAGLQQVNLAEATQAYANGWTIWRWAQVRGWFVPYTSALTGEAPVPIYASVHYQTPRP
jgi:cell wall-associated NlpC family hydrolase